MMDIVKKNILSIICGVIALAAIGVGMTMVPGKAHELQTKLDASKSNYDALNGLLTKERQLPSVDPDNATQGTLKQFPSEKVIEKGKAIIDAFVSQSGAVKQEAIAMNEHKLLLPGSLPQPMGSTAISFRNAYQQALPLPQPNNAGGGAPGSTVMKSRFAQELKAGMPPMPDEIGRKQAELAEQLKQKHMFFDQQGQPKNQQAVEQLVKDETSKLPKQMMEQVSKSCRVYISPDTFEIVPAIAAAAGAPDPVSMYNAQLSYWIQQDVVNAINEINGQSANVMEAPVKHLISIRCRNQGVPAFQATAAGSAGGDPDGTLPKEARMGPTGRACNGLYDVFHFDVKADVEADKLEEFLRGLGNRRFITPLTVDVRAVDNATALAQGHAYGDKPVVNVTATCEVLYLRAWNAQYMPAAVKTLLGIGATPGADPSAAPAAMAQ